MRIENAQACTAYPVCTGRASIPLQVTKTMRVNKTNTLHQFDPADIIGIQTPVGKVPIVFYVKETSKGGRRGIVFGGDYDSVCFMFPENEHEDWCRQPYDMRYDAVEDFDNGVESGKRRNHGILELWVSVLRKWYNGQVLFRPELKLQGCGRDSDGYPTTSEAITVEEKTRSRIKTKTSRGVNHSCGCRKGAK